MKQSQKEKREEREDQGENGVLVWRALKRSLDDKCGDRAAFVCFGAWRGPGTMCLLFKYFVSIEAIEKGTGEALPLDPFDPVVGSVP